MPSARAPRQRAHPDRNEGSLVKGLQKTRARRVPIVRRNHGRLNLTAQGPSGAAACRAEGTSIRGSHHEKIDIGGNLARLPEHPRCPRSENERLLDPGEI